MTECELDRYVCVVHYLNEPSPGERYLHLLTAVSFSQLALYSLMTLRVIDVLLIIGCGRCNCAFFYDSNGLHSISLTAWLQLINRMCRNNHPNVCESSRDNSPESGTN